MADTLQMHVALVSHTSRVSFPELAKVSAVVQKQVLRDFGPLWSVTATVDGYEHANDVPTDYWLVSIRDTIPYDAAGIHLDRDGQPYALVRYSAEWSLTASHEVLEMLADPFGNRVIAGPSVKPGQGRVRYLVEVCDPSEDEQFGYRVNDVLVSDFYTPRFFDPTTAAGVQYSFSGKIAAPRQVLEGGYISFQDVATGEWWQQRKFGTEEFVSLGLLDSSAGSKRRPGESLREAIDRLTPSVDERRAQAKEVAASLVSSAAGLNSRAARWESDVEEVLKRGTH